MGLFLVGGLGGSFGALCSISAHDRVQEKSFSSDGIVCFIPNYLYACRREAAVCSSTQEGRNG
jgi:hypothetical protein